MSDWKAKRFWKDAQVVEADRGYTVELDGRPIKTPAKQLLVLPTAKMAEAIAAEWQAQDGVINPQTMPCTKTANAAIDKVAVQHAEVADMLAAYGDCDLLCYRADSPQELVDRQAAIWDPMLDWADQMLGVRLQTRVGIMHVPQDPDVVADLTRRTHALDPFELAAFHDLVSLSGSLILGFAAAMSARDMDSLWDMSRLDEIWQAELWGKDDDAEALAAVKKDSFLHAKWAFDLSNGRLLQM
ncbi:ATP12 family chaperone protein [Sulfitobacter sp. HGT1]|jgi:chaperone required for assembly of F1-ATPase|uniref:ATP12 family chaperone protein n=1 Tax=unclassified Sulfitobacter TaxID=196795 RepID=UPI001592C443|nr:ATP12 family protein [Sulfitobacter sp. HGT1]